MSRLSLFALLPLVACGAFEPADQGSWDLSAVRVVSDGCDFGEPDIAGSSLDLSYSAADGELMSGDQVCTLDDQAFTCPEIVDQDSSGTDYTVSSGATMTGDFTSETEVTATIVVRRFCEGAGCADVEANADDVPCEFEADYDATHTGG